MSDLISVIVPIYNVAPYLEKCISSICNQSYKNLEIILVDDGSTDESGNICDEMAKKDNRIVVIHQENGKLTRARKAGMNKATGKYVGFVDGDDWIEPEMYEVLYADMVRENVSLILSGMYRDNDNGTYAKWPATRCGTGLFENERLKELKHHVRSWANWSSVNKLYSRELVKSELDRIDDDLYGIEDDIFSGGCITKVDRLYIEEKVFYHGYDRDNSATHSRHKNYYQMVDRALPYYEEMMSYGDEEMKRDLQCGFINVVMNGINEVFPDKVFPTYIFDNSNNLPMNSKIIIYGAGAVGECIYQQIVASKQFQVISWIDKSRKISKKTEKKLGDYTDIFNLKYEYILIAVLEKELADKIKIELSKQGIEDEKIIWAEPKKLIDFII